MACTNQNNLGQVIEVSRKVSLLCKTLIHMNVTFTQTHITHTSTTHSVPIADSDSALRTFVNHSLITGSVSLQIYISQQQQTDTHTGREGIHIRDIHTLHTHIHTEVVTPYLGLLLSSHYHNIPPQIFILIFGAINICSTFI